MPSGPKKRRAERKKKQEDASSTNPSDEKLVTVVELPETKSIVSEMSVCDVNTEAVSEIGSNQNKEKESESVDGVSAVGVIDIDVSGMCSKESKSQVSALNKVQENEQVMEPDVQLTLKATSEFLDDQIVPEERVNEPTLKEMQGNEPALETVDELTADLSVGLVSALNKVQENEQVMEPDVQLTLKATSELLDDQIVPEERVNEPTLKEMQGNKPAMETVDQLTADLSVGLVISKEAQDSFTEFMDPRAIVDPVFDGNTAVINQSEVVGRLKEMLDELVRRSENQLKEYKEMNVKISQLLDEIGSGKPN